MWRDAHLLRASRALAREMRVVSLRPCFAPQPTRDRRDRLVAVVPSRPRASSARSDRRSEKRWVVSTKRLSRTVIEGGRYHYNKLERRRSHRKPRHEGRRICTALALDPDLADVVTFQRRQPIGHHFRDKLAPAERWLRAQTGRLWCEVEGEILSRFDVRSLAGRHIVYDHLLPARSWESIAGWRVHRRGRFFVDAAGVLRFAPLVRSRRSFRCGRCALRFAGDRLVGKRGERTYWLEPTMPPEVHAYVPYRQARELSAEERRAYDALGCGRDAITRVLDQLD